MLEHCQGLWMPKGRPDMSYWLSNAERVCKPSVGCDSGQRLPQRDEIPKRGITGRGYSAKVQQRTAAVMKVGWRPMNARTTKWGFIILHGPTSRKCVRCWSSHRDFHKVCGSAGLYRVIELRPARRRKRKYRTGDSDIVNFVIKRIYGRVRWFTTVG
jgi:hypothetical protein